MAEREMDTAIPVESERLDQLIAAVGELGVVQGAISRLLEKARAGAGAAELTAEAQKVQRSFERSVGAVRASALDVRMVPLSRVFTQLTLLGHRLAAAKGKAIAWSAEAADAEVDKPIADGIGAALAQWIEYLVEVQGDTARAAVKLGVCARGRHHVVIEIHDDGRGLRSVPASEPSEFDRRLSLLRSLLRPLGGLIEAGDAATGSRLRVTVPVTLAVVGVLLVSVGGGTMALPLTSVEEVVRFQASQCRSIEGADAFDLRGQWLQTVRLGELLGFPTPHGETSEQHMIVVSSGARRIGLVVERALGKQSVLLKPLGRSLGGVRAFAGAVDLAGDGQLTLVIDPAAILDAYAPDRVAGGTGAV
jgi:two-component system, chemotaxis family, sensor kinase CheA